MVLSWFGSSAGWESRRDLDKTAVYDWIRGIGVGDWFTSADYHLLGLFLG
jgi:hypothetical protein